VLPLNPMTQLPRMMVRMACSNGWGFWRGRDRTVQVVTGRTVKAAPGRDQPPYVAS